MKISTLVPGSTSLRVSTSARVVKTCFPTSFDFSGSLGDGGITAVSLATGLSDRTIRNGIKELQSEAPLASTRQGRNGGRKPLEETQQYLVDAIDRLVKPTERGDPQSPLRWTCKSLSNLQRELSTQGVQVGRMKISEVLRSLDYSLQANRKTREGTHHPDRNAQFEHIARRGRACQLNIADLNPIT